MEHYFFQDCAFGQFSKTTFISKNYGFAADPSSLKDNVQRYVNFHQDLLPTLIHLPIQVNIDSYRGPYLLSHIINFFISQNYIISAIWQGLSAEVLTEKNLRLSLIFLSTRLFDVAHDSRALIL